MKTVDRDLQLQATLIAELEGLMRASKSEDSEKVSTPILGLCAETLDLDGEAATVQEVLSSGIEKVQPETHRRALEHLFARNNSRWTPLAQRGARAAAELGITYDALRRRNRKGRRQLDSILESFSSALLEDADVRDLLFGRSRSAANSISTRSVARATLFLSYARADDEHEAGFVTNLRKKLSSEFRFQTGLELSVFQDKSGIELGENWSKKLRTELERTRLLLVFLTPSYLASSACRQELELFLAREETLGRDDLVLTIYYAGLGPSESADELARALLQRQVVDWTELRFESFDSVPVRRAVAALASAVGDAIRRTDTAQPDEKTDADHQEGDGLLERIVEMELAFPRYNRALEKMSAEQEGVAEEVATATERMQRLNQMGSGSAAKLLVARKLAATLEPFATRLEANTKEMLADLDAIDDGILALGAQIPTSDEEGIESALRELIASILTASDATAGAAAAREEMVETYNSVGRQVSTLRPVLARMSASSRVIPDSSERLGTWIETLEKALESKPGDTRTPN